MEKSSNNPLAPVLKGRPDKHHGGRRYKWRMAIILPAWVALAYIVSTFVVIGILITINWLDIHPENYVKDSVYQTIQALVIYVLTLGIAIFVPMLYRHTKDFDYKDLGLDRLMTWTDIGLAPVTFIVYMIVASAVMNGVVHFIPGFPVDQAQDVGFKAFGTSMDNVLAFITLVVLAPIAEETVFRGYLYGKLNKYIPVVLSAIIVSLLFGLAHWQWNVSVNVFILSLFLCGLRSLTGSIWAGVLVHMLKNGVAYYILFIAPLIGG